MNEKDLAEALELCRKAQKEVVEGLFAHVKWVPGIYEGKPAALAVVALKVYPYTHAGLGEPEESSWEWK